MGDSEEDGLSWYLREISRVPLLTAEEEVRLAQVMECGKQERLKVSPHRRCLLDEEEAQRRLTEANLRLVVRVAKRAGGCEMSLLDRIQEGKRGLMHVVETFDVTRGYRLSAHVTWWIRQAITRALADQGRTIRLLAHVVEA